MYSLADSQYCQVQRYHELYGYRRVRPLPVNHLSTFKLYQLILSSPTGFSFVGVQFTGYTLISEPGTPSTVFGTFCSSSSTETSLATSHFIPATTWPDPDFDIAQTSFGSRFHLGCDVSEYFPSTVAPGVLPVWTGSSSPSNQLSIAPATATAASPSSSPSQTSSRWKLIIGLVVTIVFLIIFLTVGLSFFCILRRRRRREKAATASKRGARGDEGHDIGLYFQQKAELDNRPLKPQMKTIENTYELEGEDRILELEGEDRIHELEGKGRIPELPGEDKRQEKTYT